MTHGVASWLCMLIRLLLQLLPASAAAAPHAARTLNPGARSPHLLRRLASPRDFVHESDVAAEASLTNKPLQRVAEARTFAALPELESLESYRAGRHPSILHEGDCAHAVDLGKKLKAGQAVSMLVFGSSISAGGGCTHPVPGICSESQCPNCCALGCVGNKGWARDVFNAINSTWPHAGHTLRNLAQSGGGLASVMETCLKDFVAYPVDIFLLELAANGGSEEDVRRLAKNLVSDQQNRYGHDPLVMFTSFVPFKISEDDIWSQQCDGYSDTLLGIAKSMGYPAYSTRPLRTLLNESTKIRVLEDEWLHPRAEPVPELSAPIGEHIIQRVRKCAGIEHPGPKLDTTSEQWSCLRFTGDGAQKASQKQDTVKDVARAIKVVAHEGWRQIEEVKESRSPYKPGMQSNVTNATFRVQLFAEKHSFKLRGTYLTSYAGFGTARITCEVCQCPAQILLANRTAHVSIDASFSMNISSADKTCFLDITVIEPAFKITSLAMTL